MTRRLADVSNKETGTPSEFLSAVSEIVSESEDQLIVSMQTTRKSSQTFRKTLENYIIALSLLFTMSENTRYSGKYVMSY